MAFDHWSPTGCIKATRYEATDSGFARVTKLFLPPGPIHSGADNATICRIEPFKRMTSASISW